ncbi:hypothetical protein Tco_0941078 [Tanacetum coccineum]|uniref:Uncharacterized protein n=1 Tax=Tanacetum coccineum TaxID=301880 RepID=A0ABQ5DQQ0_9ASTR
MLIGVYHTHWGPKRQHFYGFAANMTSSKDVYSRKRIIAVTRLSIMEKYDYGHLEEIEVRRKDQKLYKFREDPKGVIYKDQMNINRLMCADELHKFRNGTLDDVRQNWRDLPRDIPLDSVEVLRFPDGATKYSVDTYEHVGLEVTRSQEGKRSQDDDKRLCLVDDLKEVQDSHNKSSLLEQAQA